MKFDDESAKWTDALLRTFGSQRKLIEKLRTPENSELIDFSNSLSEVDYGIILKGLRLIEGMYAIKGKY